MPELPEVETIKRVMEPRIQGLTIEKVLVRHLKVIAYPSSDEFCGRITGQTIEHLERRGKFLTIVLADHERIVLHLRMTGCLLLVPAKLPEEKHTHVVFRLSDGSELRFSDMRRFGRFWLFQDQENDTYSGIGKLGLEPFDPDFSAGYLEARLGKRKKAIKSCLLEQETIAGIGNIYSDEILFTAGIHPLRPAGSLEHQEWERLAAVIPERLSYFIEKNKVTLEEYLESKGQDYRNTPFLQVYGHEGECCPICGSKLCRMVISGRSSVYCPGCQRGLEQGSD
ncbi:MAG: bifunctional DNA-formamidopyrimidine glycosylase/DNA-(apurinic or apyrimidinic site) lyase [Firmicutes bacterium]|nr:bifunctional DNA-formamidopyrimidine glycosylase/DNA-(apurinic or apyrimidinic site) lyase [Bacillota bacterium]